MVEPNPNLCFSRKASKGEGFNVQCPNKKKVGNYCGKHTKCTDDYVPSVVKTIETEVSKIIEPTVIEIREPPVVKVEKVVSSSQTTTDCDAILTKAKQTSLGEAQKQYQNDTDFFTLESIQLIPKQYLYEYLEAGQYYAFDIRTLYDYFNSCNELEGIKNPFTNVDIPSEKVQEIKRKHKHMEKKGVQLDQYKEDVKLDPHKQLEWRCLDIFQKIDQLGHYVDYKWYWNLNLYELKKMYFGLEDLWNYRLPITKHQKQRILPHYTPFQIVTVQQYNTITDLTTARRFLLDEIEKFITMGKLEGKNGNDNKYVGSILVLTSLVEVSQIAASVLPHLIPIL
jgi:hypothetical protein